MLLAAIAFGAKGCPVGLREDSRSWSGSSSAPRSEALAEKLVLLGFARVPLVEDPGTFAVRGGIVDLWSPADAAPVRLEFFGDEIESCRAFDPPGPAESGQAAQHEIPV